MVRHRQAERNRDPIERPRWSRRAPWLVGLPLAVLLLIGAIVWISDVSHFPVRNVRVEGTLSHVSAEEIRSAVQPYVPAGLLGIDLGAVRGALEQLPWVYRAQVTRSWPDVLLVQLTEQQVLARWGDGGFVNTRGEVFQPAESAVADGFATLRGPAGTSVMLAIHFAELQQALTPLSLRITELAMDERRAWKMTLDDGVELMLGRSDHPARIARFVRAYPKVLASRVATVARVDLRYTNGFAVRWREHAAAAGVTASAVNGTDRLDQPIGSRTLVWGDLHV